MRSIVSLDIDSFPVALEQARWPRLRGRPVALAAEEKLPVRVQVASREARAEGVLPGMLLSAARRECRSLVVLPPEEMLYRAASASIAALLRRHASLVEEAQPGQFYLDLTSRSRIGARDLALGIRDDVDHRVSLHPALGAATNKLVSGIAARLLHPEGDLCEVAPGEERDFLAPLLVRVLPGIGSATERALLHELNIRVVGQIAALPLEPLAAVFGRRAIALRRFALGIDESPVGAAPPERGIDAEERLIPETNHDGLLLAAATRLVAQLAFALRKTRQAAGALSFRAEYADGKSCERTAKVVPRSALDSVLATLLPSLLEGAVTRRVNVRSVRLRVLRLAPSDLQLELFPDAPGSDVARNLYGALDRLHDRFGAGVIQTGRARVERSANNALRAPARP